MAITGIRTIPIPESGPIPDSGPIADSGNLMVPHPKTLPVKRTTKKRSPAQINGDETRSRIIRACLDAVSADGITNASARAIARIGDFNQALIFYHFGSVEGLLIAAAKVEGEARSTRYAERFASVTTLPELIAVAWGGTIARRRLRAIARWVAAPLLQANAAVMLALASGTL